MDMVRLDPPAELTMPIGEAMFSQRATRFNFAIVPFVGCAASRSASFTAYLISVRAGSLIT